MENIKFKIHTPYGDTFLINDKGEICKQGNSFSGQWKLQGIESVKSNYFIPFSKITKEFISSIGGLLYKNGNPKYTVRDLDHNTTGVWGNTKYHGIKSIQFIEN